MLLRDKGNFAETSRQFRWPNPTHINIAEAICDRHVPAAADTVALSFCDHNDLFRHWTYRELQSHSCKLAHGLAALGIGAGDRVAILLGQQIETVLTHIANARLGAIGVPLFRLFGPDALAYRLANSGAKILITDAAGYAAVAPIRDTLIELEEILLTDGDPGSFWPLLDQASDQPVCAQTNASDPFCLIYTSGTTGSPKGAVLSQQTLLGHLPGVQMPHEFFPQAGDRFWTPADWAWIGGLFDVLLPSLYCQIPVVGAAARKFDPEWACWLMAKQQVRNVFFPPAALRAIKNARLDPQGHGVKLRSIGSGGEPLSDELHAWAHAAFATAINEFYGQTEANLTVSGMAGQFPRQSGHIGKAVPGHSLAILTTDGCQADAGEVGEIALNRTAPDGSADPVIFSGYWRNPAASAAKFSGDWLLTGDLGAMDDQGYIQFVARQDDLINVKGYRIGPAEIERCLERHPAVSKAAVIAEADQSDDNQIVAFVQLDAQAPPQNERELTATLRAHVQDRLAKHMAPHRVNALAELPVTATGKLKRAALRQK